MTKSEKLLNKAQENPNGLRFSELETLMQQSGWKLDHQKGSHRVWLSNSGVRLPVQNNNGKAKGYQVKQFLKQRELEVDHEK